MIFKIIIFLCSIYFIQKFIFKTLFPKNTQSSFKKKENNQEKDITDKAKIID